MISQHEVNFQLRGGTPISNRIIFLGIVAMGSQFLKNKVFKNFSKKFGFIGNRFSLEKMVGNSQIKKIKLWRLNNSSFGPLLEGRTKTADQSIFKDTKIFFDRRRGDTAILRDVFIDGYFTIA